MTAASAGALTLSLSLGAMAPAFAETKEAGAGITASERANIEMIETVDAATIESINSATSSSGSSQLPKDTVAFGFNSNGDAVAVNHAGQETLLSSAQDMEAEMESLPRQSAGGAPMVQVGSDKGIIGAAASTIAGCAGGAIGYDEILDILERRASYWTVVKFIAKKTGPGLAISCIAGAGGGLALYMGW